MSFCCYSITCERSTGGKSAVRGVWGSHGLQWGRWWKFSIAAEAAGLLPAPAHPQWQEQRGPARQGEFHQKQQFQSWKVCLFKYETMTTSQFWFFYVYSCVRPTVSFVSKGRSVEWGRVNASHFAVCSRAEAYFPSRRPKKHGLPR